MLSRLNGFIALGGRPKAVGGGTPTPTPSAIQYGRTTGYDAGTAADYYWDPVSGSDLAAGSFAAPFKTPQKAHDTATSGQTIRGRVGTSYSRLIQTKPLTITGYGTEVTTISGALKVSDVASWTACVSGDAAIVGASWASIYKATITKSGNLDPETSGGNPNFNYYNAMMLTENGILRDLVQRRSDTSDLFEQADSGTMYKKAVDNTIVGTVDGSYYYATLAHPSVIGSYTDAQLARMYVMVHAAANSAGCMKVQSASGGTLTFAASQFRPQGYNNLSPPGTLEYTYALLNALPSIAAGQWGFVDNGSTLDLYFWPTNPALLSTVEVISKTDVINVSAAAAGSVYRNIHFTAAADSAGSGVAMFTAGISTSGPANMDIQQCIQSRFSHRQKGYASLYAPACANFTFKRNEVYDGQNQFGVFFNRGAATLGTSTGLRVAYNHFHRISQTAVRAYGQWNFAVYHNLFENVGKAAHANKFNAYVGSDTGLLFGNYWKNCDGYITNQEMSRFYVFNNWSPASTIDGRGYVDQTNVEQPPVDPSNNYFVGNFMPKPAGALADGTAVKLGNSTATAWLTNWAAYNNVAHGFDIEADQNIGQDYNIDTRGAAMGANDIAVTEPLAIYYDASLDNFNTVPGSILLTSSGRDVSTIVAAAQSAFPDIDVYRDIDGNVWNPAASGRGPWAKGSWPIQNDVTAPVLSNFTASSPNSSVDLGIDVDEKGSSIYWVRLANGATTPSAAQIIAGQDASGAAAGQSGSLLLVTTTGTKAIGSISGASATYKICVVARDRNGNVSNIVTGSATIASFTPMWRAFDGVQWLRRGTGITGAQTTTKTWIMAYTVKRSSGQNGTNTTGGVLSTLPTNGNHVIDTASVSTNGRLRAKHKLSGGTTAVFDKSAPATGGMVADEEYCVIESYTSDPGGGAIGKMKMIKISDGTLISNQPTDYTGSDGAMTFASTTTFDIFKAALSAERFMLWDNAYGAADDSAVQLLFVKSGGGLQDPAVAAASLGTPLVSIYGANLSTGVNSGSGGDWSLS